MSKQKNYKQRSVTEADKEFGERIRTRRVELRMSQAELGKVLGVSFQQVQKYEKGVNRVSAARLVTIATALKIGTDYFIHVASKQESTFIPMLTDRASQRLLLAFHKIEKTDMRYKVIGLLEAMVA